MNNLNFKFIISIFVFCLLISFNSTANERSGPSGNDKNSIPVKPGSLSPVGTWVLIHDNHKIELTLKKDKTGIYKIFGEEAEEILLKWSQDKNELKLTPEAGKGKQISATFNKETMFVKGVGSKQFKMDKVKKK